MDWTSLHLTLAVVAAVAGLLSHLLYFIHGERHTDAVRVVQLYLVLPPTAVVLLCQCLHLALRTSLVLVLIPVGCYSLSLGASIVIYRTLFHPLRTFPGPPLAKVSKFYHASRLTGFDNYRVLAAWHDRYGDVVRTGPNEVTVITPNAQTTILGPQSQCLKSSWYDHEHGQDIGSLHSARDVAIHQSRRRIWDRGFGMKALRFYEPRITHYTRSLISVIARHASTPIEASRYFNHYAFDAMGSLAFGESFHNLSTGREHPAVAQLHRAMLPVALLTAVTWMIPIFVKLPKVADDFNGFVTWCAGQIEKRRDMKVEDPDIASWLLQAFDESPDPAKDRKWLHGDSRLVVVAGSDTLTASLTFVFYHLASHPEQVAKLREEIDALWPDGEEFDAKKVANAEHLNAIIHEGLRMHPPVASGVSRVTPKEGVEIDGVFIPGGVTISVPSWAIGRVAKYFPSPNAFIPERWTTRPDLLLNRNAFAPFSLGPFGCIGRNLALMQLRTALCMITRRFDVALAPGEDGTGVLWKTVDAFTTATGPLYLVFSERNGMQGDGAATEGPEVKAEDGVRDE